MNSCLNQELSAADVSLIGRGVIATNRKTANYRVLSVDNGRRYQFFCDLSGALVCTTQPVLMDTPEQELAQAWEGEGKSMFNHCKKCGKWVSDVMFNPEVLECVTCAPFEGEPKYCKTCGAKIISLDASCPSCGHPLIYERRLD